jgi:Transposase DDE domain
MKKEGIRVEQLLNYLPDSDLEAIGESSKVDYQVKRLHGKTVFKLLLYGLLTQKELSLRILETLFENTRFQTFAEITNVKPTDHSSIGDRLSTMKLDYFEAIYKQMSQRLSKEFSAVELKNIKIVRFDSTIVSISSKLLKINGIKNGGKSKKEDKSQLNIKFTIGFDGLIPKEAVFQNEQTYVSEQIALGEALSKAVISEDEMLVFDQGMSSRKRFGEMNSEGKLFVTRTRAQQPFGTKYKKVKDLTVFEQGKEPQTKTLTILSDEEVYLYDDKTRKTKFTLRLIKAIRNDNNTPIWFLTNNFDLSVEDITEIYRLRWDIELFFRFLKQEFGFTHLVSRNENGIKIMLYMSLIAIMLIYIYRKLNAIESFRIAKLKFVNELDNEILKLIIQLCQGKPELLDLLHELRI